jgi:hypothetical protein
MEKEENINIKLTKEQRNILTTLCGEMGSSEPEVMRSIFTAWLSEKGLISELIKKRLFDKK